MPSNTHADLIAALKTQVVSDTAISVDYTFTPSDGNYSGVITGTINFKVVDITFGGSTSVETTATYGTTWETIFTNFKESNYTAIENDMVQ